MPHYSALSGRHFALVFIEAGWKEQSTRAGRIVLSKDGAQVGISTTFSHSEKRVRALCESHDISTERFEELLRRVLAKEGQTDAAKPKIH